MDQVHITLNTEILQRLFLSEDRDEALSKLMETIFNEILAAQSTELLGAEPLEYFYVLLRHIKKK